MELELYLERIGVENIKLPSAEFLAELQCRHMLSIPFENLDIPSIRIDPDPEKLFDKIITRKRGGFCYELNSLFYRLLVHLGFKVDMLSARVFNNDRKDLGPEFDHMCLLVHLDKMYLTDVGFGDSCRFPLTLPNGSLTDISGRYRIFKKDKDTYKFCRKENNKWLLKYIFTTAPRNITDYMEMCNYQQDDPEAHFRKCRVCTIATESGRITLTGNSLTITEGTRKNRMDFSGEENFNLLLNQYFGIKL